MIWHRVWVYKRTWAMVILFCLYLVVGCTTPQPTAIPAPTLTPTLTPTPFAVAELPTVNPQTTPTGTPSGPEPTAVLGTPAQGSRDSNIVRGAPLFTLPDASREQIRSIELHPTQSEMLITLYNGVDEQVQRVRWDGPQPVAQVIPNAPLQIRYAPDGGRIIGDGLSIAAADLAFQPLKPTGPAARTPAATDVVTGTTAAWSPDGRKLAFIRPRPDTTPECEGAGAAFCTSLVIYDFSTQAEQIVATAPYLSGPPSWSPDQAQLLATISGEVGGSLVVVSAAGGPIKALLPNFDAPPDANTFVTAQWLPGSQAILYATQASALYTVPIAGGLPQALINNAEKPYLVPDTQIVVFLRPLPGASDQRRTYQLWQFSLAAPDNAQPLSPAAIVCNNATWARNGRTLACVDVLADDTRAVLLYGITPRL